MLNQNVTLLNFHAALQRFSNKTLDVFGGIYFLTHGVPFPVVALMWSASFLIRFFLRPLSVWLSNRIGLKAALTIGTIISSGLFLVFTMVDGLNIWLLIFAIYLAFYDILYYLPYHTFYAVSGEEKDRGKQVAFGAGLINIVQIAVPILGAILATTFGFGSLYLSAMACMILSVVPVLFSENKSPGRQMGFKQAYAEIDKRGLVMSVGEGIVANAHEFLWTIVLFLLVGNLINFGGLITIELFLITILSLIIGHFIDKGSIKWVAYLGLGIVAVAVIARSLWVSNIPQIIIINFVAAIGEAFYIMAYRVSIYNFAKRSHNTLWFHFFAEAGWDIGSALAMLVAAGLFVMGVSLQHIMLFALIGLLIINRVLKGSQIITVLKLKRSAISPTGYINFPDKEL